MRINLKNIIKKKIAKEIIVNVEALECRLAVLENAVLEDFFVERSSEERLVGSILKGKIQNLEDGLQAAFVDIGMKKNAFIHYWDMIPEDTVRLEAEEGAARKNIRKKRYEPGEMEKRFPIGTEIVVQVTKDAIGTKGPRVTANLSIAGRYLVMMPGSKLKGVSKKIGETKERQRLKKILSRLPIPDKLGIIIRTAGSGARKTSFARDLRGLIEIWNTIEQGIQNASAPCRLYAEPNLVERVVRDSLTEDIDRILIDDKATYEGMRELLTRISRRSRKNLKMYDGSRPIFEQLDIERQLKNAYRRKIWLPGGGYLIFDETEALVAIDINTGRHKGSSKQEEAITEVNLEAVREIARQLKLRNVGGLVVIDFIDMKLKRNRNHVYRSLRDAVRKDRARTNLLPISDLGLLEMTRQRAEGSIGSSGYNNCPYCRGHGKIKSNLSMSVEIQRNIAEVIRKHQGEEKQLTLKIIVHPTILERLRRADESLLMDIEEQYGVHLTFVADPNLHIEEYTIKSTDGGTILFTNVDQHSGQVKLT